MPMGPCISNLQVLVDGDPAAALQSVLDALRALANGTKLRLAADDEEADRTVLVAPGTRFIAVYDEHTEGKKHRALHQSARAVSMAVGAYVVAILAHDGEVLDLGLVRGSELLDHYVSDPGGVSAAMRRKLAGHAHRWAPVLAEGHNTEELAEILASDAGEAEDTLIGVADALGLDFFRAAASFGNAPASSGLLELRFRRNDYTTSTALEGTPPALRWYGGPLSETRHVGEKVHYGWTMRNSGGPIRGLDIVLSGAAVEQGLLDISEVNLVACGSRGLASMAQTKLTVCASGARARFPAARVRAAATPEAIAGAPFQMRSDLQHRSTVHVNVLGQAARVGTGDLEVRFICLEHPDVEGNGRVMVRVAPRRRAFQPMHCAPGVWSHYLEQLTGYCKLFALAVLRGHGSDARARAAELLRVGISRWPEYGVVHALLYRTQASAPETIDEDVQPFVAKTLTSILDDHAGRRLMSAQHRADKGPFAVAKNHGCALGRSVKTPSIGTGEEACVALVWLDAEVTPEGELEATAHTLRRAIDALVRDGLCLQAMCGRWDWHHPDIHATPYEQACGIEAVPTSIEWLSRYVRGVTDDSMWLGPELLARLKDRTALHNACEVEIIGDGMRLGVRAGVELRAVEEALEPLLPRCRASS